MMFFLSSCGKGGRKPVYPVRGKVLDRNNKPAAGALIVFHPVNAGPDDLDKPRAYVDDNGAYSLTTYEQGDGAPEGEYVITIEWRPKKKTPYDREPEDMLQGRYSKPKTSKLRARVEKQEMNDLKAFHLQ
jgi:hypothetical protein